MRKVITMLCVVLNACAHSTTYQAEYIAQKEGEKQMATLIFNEQFINQDLRSRGWSDTADGYYFTNDTTLNKQVMYARWTNGKQGMPDNDAGTIPYYVSAAQFNAGVTIYSAVRLHNWIWNGTHGGSHAGIRANTRGVEGNAPGEIMLEALRNGYGTVTMPSNAYDVDRQFTVAFDGSSSQYDRHWVDLENGSYLEDDVWYETVLYLDTNNGGSNGRVALWYRVYGDTNWTSLFDFSGVRLIDTPTTNPFVGFGPYFHQNFNTNEVRVEYGWMTVWSGDAMADGDIEGGIGGGTEPTDPLAISNHKVSTTDTTATLTWTTNKPANSVVDYGATEARGTIARGDTNATEHTINLSGLTANTTYYYRYSSRTTDGSETVMDQANSTFITKETDNGGGTEPEPVEISLDDLTDVKLATPVEGQVLMYRSGKWVNVDARPLVAQLVEEILGETSLVVNKPSA